MKNKIIFFILNFLWCFTITHAQELFKAPSAGTETRWISPENLTGKKGAAAVVNKGAKGKAFVNLLAGDTLVMMDIQGSGIVNRMWMSGTIPRVAEQRRMIKIEMYWDGETTPAVSAPVGDFFGCGLGLAVPFENALFSNPEGRSFNFTIPMPYRKAAKIILINQSPSHALVWFDINYTIMKTLPPDALYFHAYWNRDTATELGKDYVVLPAVNGVGRYLGTNIGVIGDSTYRGTWFGEGEVKIYLDGDKQYPTLAGTGTEDYIGSGWGQGEYCNRNQGSLLSDDKNDIYAFYRFHLPDPVYFHQNCKVTIQQVGNAPVDRIRQMVLQKKKVIPAWVFKAAGSNDIFNLKGAAPVQIGLLETGKSIFDEEFSTGVFSANFYRSDDVSSTAYFYLDKPYNNLHRLADKELPAKNMQSRVWDLRAGK